MSNATVERMKMAVKLHKELDEVAAGKRGFVSFTSRRANEFGISQEVAANWAFKAGLISYNHGRFGLCFSRP